MSAPTTSLGIGIGIAVAQRLSKLTQPWHPRRYSSADLHRTSGTSRTGPGPGLRHSAVGYAVGVSFEHEPDPYDLAFWGGNPADILSEPAGGHNHGRRRTGDGKPPKAHKAGPRSGWDILGTYPSACPGSRRCSWKARSRRTACTSRRSRPATPWAVRHGPPSAAGRRCRSPRRSRRPLSSGTASSGTAPDQGGYRRQR